jgi:diadenylate cyclase
MLQNAFATLNNLSNEVDWLDLPRFNSIDAVEIIVISFLIYWILIWTRNTKAWNLLRGILVIVMFYLIATVLQMNAILWIMQNTFNVAIIGAVIVFQPELRRALEQLGRKNILTSWFNFNIQKEQTRFSEHTLNEISKAVFEMAKVKTGALIVIERDMVLSEYEITGITLDSLVSSQLLINIFEHNTPLHDGAIIVRGDRIIAATCYLPLSDNMQLSKDLGTRHRAAVGTTEHCDAMVVVVSEETGNVSVALDGRLYKNLDMDSLKRHLSNIQIPVSEPQERIKTWKRRLKDVAQIGRKSDS